MISSRQLTAMYAHYYPEDLLRQTNSRDSPIAQAKDTPYLLQTLIEDVLVLPPKYIPELRMLPGSKLSASHALVVSVLGQYSGVDVILKDRQAYDVTRSQLTKSLRKECQVAHFKT